MGARRSRLKECGGLRERSTKAKSTKGPAMSSTARTTRRAKWAGINVVVVNWSGSRREGIGADSCTARRLRKNQGFPFQRASLYDERALSLSGPTETAKTGRYREIQMVLRLQRQLNVVVVDTVECSMCEMPMLNVPSIQLSHNLSARLSNLSNHALTNRRAVELDEQRMQRLRSVAVIISVGGVCFVR